MAGDIAIGEFKKIPGEALRELAFKRIVLHNAESEEEIGFFLVPPPEGALRKIIENMGKACDLYHENLQKGLILPEPPIKEAEAKKE